MMAALRRAVRAVRRVAAEVQDGVYLRLATPVCAGLYLPARSNSTAVLGTEY